MSTTQTHTDTTFNTAVPGGESLALNKQPRLVDTKISFFSPPTDGVKPWVRAYNADANGEFAKNWSTVEHDVQIEDLRGKEGTVSLDVQGFQFGSHATKVQKAFYDEEEIEKVYYPESIELIKSVTGASRVVVFDHTVRRHIPGENGTISTKRQPAKFAHVDQTPAAAEARVHRHLPAEEAAEFVKKRYQIINLWRPISHPAWDMPLAVCDYTSVDFKKDLYPSSLIYEDRVGETFNVTYSPDYKWKYVSGLRPDEYLLIKCSETKQGVAQLTPHSAFSDPTTPSDAPLRQSIELRTLVFYD